MSVNKVILVGHVGKDPEVRYIDNNVAVANFTLATTERGFTTRSGQTVAERTEWHNLVVWRGLAQVVEKYVKKGTQLYVEGKIRSRSYDDKDNIKRYITEIFVDNLVLLGRKGDGAASGQQSMQAQAEAAPPAPVNAQSPASSEGMMSYGSNYDSSDFSFGADAADDLPF